MTQRTVWIVDDDSSIRWVLEKALKRTTLQVRCFESAHALLDALSHDTPDTIVSDIRMPDMNGLTLLQKIKQDHPLLPVIIITAHSDLDAAVNAYQKGAFDYLPKPFDINDAIHLIERAVTHFQELKRPAQAQNQDHTADDILIGEAPAMQEVYRIIGRLSRSSMSVLINGESGTGKELVAQALHRHSPRVNEPFIALNMAAIPKDLIESELFGHEKGAFTGATQIRPGRFEQANGGTLFLDEIGDMPFDVQTRLLRVLADGQFYRVGGLTPIKVDVRIIAATHQDLEQLVIEHKFREDLFHRLNVIRIHLPPLRERREDIPRLAEHFLNQAAIELGVERKTLHADTLALLCQRPWTGNVRELENTCRWLTVMSSSQEILVQDLPATLLEQTDDSHISGTTTISSTTTTTDIHIWQHNLAEWAHHAIDQGKHDLIPLATQDLESTLINIALQHTQGHKQDAARLLGWGRNTLTRKMKELKIVDDSEA